ncbi:peptidase [Kitasatospora sp. NPDC052896]|uniref:peptidase n=1 Tax=Kitasatospora sp. NPDC052896 TaxID=3364061 RepID=UPI0037C966EF
MHRHLRTGLTALAGGLLTLGPATAARADAAPSASPSPSAGGIAPATTAGTSFLTATNLAPGQDATVAASTGDYLYWGFGASEGQTPTATLTVTLPPAADRHGPQTWTVELLDGLRRRQACTAGTQIATAAPSAPSVTVSCTLRQIRSWAEPWSGDPLPGTYYVKLSATDAPQQDLGLPTTAQLHISSTGDADDAQPEGGALKAPLVPPVHAGVTLAPDATALPSATPSPGAGAVAATPAGRVAHWYSDWFSQWNSRWGWTLAGGVLAALAGVGGFTLTRHPRGRRPGAYRPGAVPRPASAERYTPDRL